MHTASDELRPWVLAGALLLGGLIAVISVATADSAQPQAQASSNPDAPPPGPGR